LSAVYRAVSMASSPTIKTAALTSESATSA
jgi:hypothetical protein